LVGRAPVDLVEDATTFRGYREIRYPGSCVQCHSTGLNELSLNEFQAFKRSGAKVYVNSKLGQIQTEAFHLSDVNTEIQTDKKDFSAAVEFVNPGWTAAENAAAFRRVINRYDKPLNLEDTARELGTTVDEWKAAIVNANLVGNNLGARLIGLVHGRTIARKAWEAEFQAALAFLNTERVKDAN
jgi:hypothetical protein